MDSHHTLGAQERVVPVLSHTGEKRSRGVSSSSASFDHENNSDNSCERAACTESIAQKSKSETLLHPNALAEPTIADEVGTATFTDITPLQQQQWKGSDAFAPHHPDVANSTNVFPLSEADNVQVIEVSDIASPEASHNGRRTAGDAVPVPIDSENRNVVGKTLFQNTEAQTAAGETPMPLDEAGEDEWIHADSQAPGQHLERYLTLKDAKAASCFQWSEAEVLEGSNANPSETLATGSKPKTVTNALEAATVEKACSLSSVGQVRGASCGQPPTQTQMQLEERSEKEENVVVTENNPPIAAGENPATTKEAPDTTDCPTVIDIADGNRSVSEAGTPSPSLLETHDAAEKKVMVASKTHSCTTSTHAVPNVDVVGCDFEKQSNT